MKETSTNQECRASTVQSSLMLLHYRQGEQTTLLKAILARLSLGSPIQGSPISSKAGHPIETDMRSLKTLFGALSEAVELTITILRLVWPWALMLASWLAAGIVAAWKGVLPYFGGLLSG